MIQEFQYFKVHEVCISKSLCFRSWVLHVSVCGIHCFQLYARSSQTHLHERLKSGIGADLEQVPQEGYWCGTRRQLSTLVDPFPGDEDKQTRQAECQKYGGGPSQLHGARARGCVQGIGFCLNTFCVQKSERPGIQAFRVWMPSGKGLLYLGGGYVTSNLPPA